MAKSPKDTKGPVVKTGPTKGKNRSRNDDGRWRGKRSDSGKPRDKGNKKSDKDGCFLTTAACEHRGLADNCYELRVLRMFRDEVLLTTLEGRALVEEYYSIAPDLVPLLNDKVIAEQIWKSIEVTIFHIENGKPPNAISAYREMVRFLQSSPHRSHL